jgi:hypothetical protein
MLILGLFAGLWQTEKRVSTQDDPEPDWDKLRENLVDNTNKGSSRPQRDRDVTAGNYLSSSFSSTHDSMFSGIIRNNRLRKRRRPSNLDDMELAAYYAEPSYVILRRPKNNAHWRW